ncbi:DUF4179 domain-containing protein [Pseudalkalibacillus berkeleyi]|uniref:DUF4179 domain-containing protein n=1 Tax=Pseudalkalibacillus berkeleyi TaxID=1069813 RepID=A0ABS9GY48_9BACL|nr:DUF4179 domain-containing protein [Pseudalkalibacillus berkeleyi]MCF6136418.1 DUF4179 domain-containing protein [Pseudalkalibacillus berkeleyi]
MNKDWFEKETEKIEVPKEDVFNAISLGIHDGRKHRVVKKRKKALKLSTIVSSAAASLVLASGFLFAPMNDALAKVPLLGSLYEHLSVGSELFASNLVTELDEKATSKGVDITIRSAYYDGNVIGVTFKAEGEKLTIENMDVGNRPVSGFSYHLFDGLDQTHWSSSSPELKETKDGTFVGAIEFYNDQTDLPENFTLPLTFTHMADVNGKWKFDIPIEQIPPEKIEVSGQSIYDEGSYQVEMESIIKGKATTMLEYTVTVPEKGKNDEIILSVFDDQKNRLSKSHANKIDESFEDGQWKLSYRELFTSKINEDAKHLEINLDLRKREPRTFEGMSQPVPFTVKSKRFDYQINVEKIEKVNDELIIDYVLQNVAQGEFRKDLLMNFANWVRIIPTEKIENDENGELGDSFYEYVSRDNKAKLIDKEKMQFQSRIQIKDPDSFNMKDYSLVVPFENLSSNDSIIMDPIKIDLK